MSDDNRGSRSPRLPTCPADWVESVIALCWICVDQGEPVDWEWVLGHLETDDPATGKMIDLGTNTDSAVDPLTSKRSGEGTKKAADSL